MGLGDGSVRIVCKAVREGYYSRLDLSKNLIKDDGLKILAACIQGNSTIVHLNLSGNLISSEGACVLF
jgi:hypothetical protein